MTEYTELLQDLVEKSHTAKSFRGSTDGSADCAYFYYLEASKKYIEVVKDKDWVLYFKPTQDETVRIEGYSTSKFLNDMIENVDNKAYQFVRFGVE